MSDGCKEILSSCDHMRVLVRFGPRTAQSTFSFSGKSERQRKFRMENDELANRRGFTAAQTNGVYCRFFPIRNIRIIMSWQGKQKLERKKEKNICRNVTHETQQ